MTSSICLVANNVMQSLIGVPLVLPWILAPTHALIDEGDHVSIWTCDSSTGRYHDNNVQLVSDDHHQQHRNISYVEQAEDQPSIRGITTAVLVGGDEQMEQPPSHSGTVTVIVNGEECVLYQINGDWQSEHYYGQPFDDLEQGYNNNYDRVGQWDNGYNNKEIQQTVDDNNERALQYNGDKATLHVLSCGRRRKQLNPRRSAFQDDPHFRGVIVRMKTLFDGKHCRLDTSCEYRSV